MFQAHHLGSQCTHISLAHVHSELDELAAKAVDHAVHFFIGLFIKNLAGENVSVSEFDGKPFIKVAPILSRIREALSDALDEGLIKRHGDHYTWEGAVLDMSGEEICNISFDLSMGTQTLCVHASPLSVTDGTFDYTEVYASL